MYLALVGGELTMKIIETKSTIVEAEPEDTRVEEHSSPYSSSSFVLVFLEGDNTLKVTLTREFAKTLISQIEEALSY
jgi:hypothetical protein